jgi:hypothetical protein
LKSVGKTYQQIIKEMKDENAFRSGRSKLVLNKIKNISKKITCIHFKKNIIDKKHWEVCRHEKY